VLVLALALTAAGGCDDDPEDPAGGSADEAAPGESEAPAEAAPSEAATADGEEDDALDPDAPARPAPGSPARPPRAEDEPQETPLEFRITERAMMIYAEPRYEAPFRGKLPRRETFAVYEAAVAGDPRCEGDGWARVGVSAYACMEHTSATKTSPTKLPVLARDQLTPFYYARRDKKAKEGVNPPRWSSRAAMQAGSPAADVLQPEHDYAFLKRRRTSDGVILTDAAFRVVREADVDRLQPSDFSGRDLVQTPIPEGRVLAWSVVWRHATVRGDAHPEADEVGRVKFHEIVYVLDAPKLKRGEAFYPVADGEGWLSDEEIQRFVPMARPSGIGDTEIWLDVELEEQTLAVMHGDDAQFVTLISSGSHKHPTPPGIYRLESKMGYSDMRSRADEDEPYHVEAVPWVMYFDGRYALHGTFWHNRFGRRTSHGCVNLSAKDARRVYDVTAPHPPGGWLSIYSHPEDPGTVVRIRKGSAEPPDRRGA
jgi:hypothetical protein